MKLKIRRRYFYLALLVVYSLVMMTGCVADRLILYPSTNPVDPQGALRRPIPYNGGTLEVWTARSPGAMRRQPEAFVLEFIGNADRAEYGATYRAWRWGSRPVEVWTVNYPGFGGSTGPARLKSIPPSALFAYDQLKKVAGARPIFVNGASLGSTAALHVAANRPCRGMIIHNPPPLQNLIMDHFGWWNLWLIAGPVAMQVPGEMNSLDNAPRVHVPAVFLLAEHDEVVPPQYQQKVVAAYAGEKKIIPLNGAMHNTPIDPAAEKQLDAAIDWLWNSR